MGVVENEREVLTQSQVEEDIVARRNAQAVGMIDAAMGIG